VDILVAALSLNVIPDSDTCALNIKHAISLSKVGQTTGCFFRQRLNFMSSHVEQEAAQLLQKKTEKAFHTTCRNTFCGTSYC